MTSGPHHQSGFDVRFGWGGDGLGALGATAAAVVVVDVLSFSTSVDVAVGRGAAVYPYGGLPEEAQSHAARLDASLVGPRSVDDRTSWSLSPASLTSVSQGTRLLMRSLNGSVLAAAAADMSPVVIAGCLRNAGAVGRFLEQSEAPVAVVAAGERWSDGGALRFAVEDLLGAGAIIAALRWGSLSPEAKSAVACYRAARTSLGEWLRHCSSGLELIDDGHAADVDLAAELDASEVVPVLVDGAFRDGLGA